MKRKKQSPTRVLIKKTQAAQFMRNAGYNLDEVMNQRGVWSGELMLLPGGAKLFITRIGCVRRFGIYGYRSDGADVKRALASLI